MKYKIHKEVKESYPIISLLPVETIGKLKYLCAKNHWQFSDVRQQLKRINLPKEAEFKFYKKIMETTPGFDKGDK
jgi:hypothetical protein